jgi:2-phospho-L-lactate guanylyltransferase (CobY/MobA/RfbA family)
MSIVKITDRKGLDELMSRLALTLGRVPNQQDVLDYCVKLALSNIDKLILLMEDVPVINKEKIERIKKLKVSHAGIPYDNNAVFPNSEDQDLLG